MSIASSVKECFQIFKALCGKVETSEDETIRSSLDDFKEELGRFRVWSGNIAAHRSGASSLDYRLRDASDLKDKVMNLLTDLLDALQNAEYCVTEFESDEEFEGDEDHDADNHQTKRDTQAKDTHEDRPTSKYLDNPEDSGAVRDDQNPESDAKPIRDGPVEPTDRIGINDHIEVAGPSSVNQPINLSDGEIDSESEDELHLSDFREDIEEIITCLMRLSVVMRKPVPHDHISKPREVIITHYETLDMDHVRNKFPKAHPAVAERLGKAISQRRHYLKYRESHANKLAQGMEWDDDGKTIAKPPSTVVSSLAAGGQGGIDLDDAASESSLSSYQSSGLTEGKLRPPPLPEAGRDGNPFECPLCRLMVTVSNTRLWKKHIYRDLFPYACTFVDCPVQHQTFESRRAWIKHELDFHRQSWSCIYGCKSQFMSKGKLEEHLVDSHAVPPSDISKLGALINMNSKSQVKDADLLLQCPLCEEQQESKQKLIRHICRHQEELALFAIPSELFGTETAEDEVDAELDESQGIKDILSETSSVSYRQDELVREEQLLDTTETEARPTLEERLDNLYLKTKSLEQHSEDLRQGVMAGIEAAELVREHRKKKLAELESAAEEEARKIRSKDLLENAARSGINALGLESDQRDGVASSAGAEAPQPTYIKIHKQHLDVETLEYYKVRWEYDHEDPSYFIILQEMTTEETDIMFEHTRRRRKNPELFIEDRGRRDGPEYAWVRRKVKPATRQKRDDDAAKKLIDRAFNDGDGADPHPPVPEETEANLILHEQMTPPRKTQGIAISKKV